MRTLIISDLHLGMRLGQDVLQRPESLSRLLAALDDVDRLVLLGDVVELMEGRSQHAMRTAEPVMRAIGQRLGPSAEVVIVPGNHDAPMVRRWIRETGRRLTVDSEVPLDASPYLARLACLLRPARVTARYPGVWLTPRLWATHGHYINRHLIPASAVGIAHGVRRPGEPGSVAPADYELARAPSLARATRVLPDPVVAKLGDIAERARSVTARWRRHLLRPHVSPLLAWLLGVQMHRASLPAMAAAARLLGIEAEWIVFGHVHRLGPLADDAAEHWQAPCGGPAMLNCGSWLYEPMLVHGATPPHPYWPGGAIELRDDGPPRAIGLLDGLSADELR